MKKIISIILAMAMAFTLLSLPVMAKPYVTLDSDLMPVKENILNLEFNDSANRYWGNYIGESGFFWNNGSVGANAVSVAGGDLTAGNYLNVTGEIYMQLKHPSTGANGWAATAAEYDVETNPLRGSYVTEFKFMLPEMPAVAMKSFYTAHSNSGEGTSHGPKLWITTSGSLNAYTTNGAAFTAASLSVGTWYTLKIVNNLDTDSYDLYLNGVLVANDAGYCDGKFYADSFSRPFMMKTEGNKVYIDDIKMYKEVVGRQTFAADDFSSYSTDAAYNSTTELREFGGFALYPRNGYQAAVKVDALNQRAELSAGAYLFAGFAKTWNQPDNTLTDSLIGKKQISVEFDFTPTAETIGDFYQISDAVGTHYGLILSADKGVISAKIGAEGDVTPSSANRGVTLASFVANETYRVKVYVDLDKKFTQNLTGNSNESHNIEHTRSGKADIYIDGKLVGSELPLRYNCGSSSNASYDITNLGRPFAANGGASATYYIDNLAVYTDVRNKVLSTALNSVEKTVSSKTFELPASTVDGYAITWSSNSDAIAISGNTATVTTGTETQKVTLTASVADSSNEFAVAGKVDVTVAPDYEVYVRFIDGEGNTVNGPAAETKLYSITFYDNYSSGKEVDLFAAVYNSDKSMSICKLVRDVTSGKVNTIETALESGQSVRAFVLTDNTLAPVEFTQINAEK